jgi:hypothetical protein
MSKQLDTNRWLYIQILTQDRCRQKRISTPIVSIPIFLNKFSQHCTYAHVHPVLRIMLKYKRKALLFNNTTVEWHHQKQCSMSHHQNERKSIAQQNMTNDNVVIFSKRMHTTLPKKGNVTERFAMLSTSSVYVSYEISIMPFSDRRLLRCAINVDLYV